MFNTPSIEQLRQATSTAEQTNYTTSPTHDTHESIITIPMRDGYLGEARIIKPNILSKNAPLVILIHGGGYIMGTNMQCIPWARPIAALYGAIIALPSYRVAPEYKFPFAPHDIWDSVSWLASNASSLGADLRAGFVIGGCSAGAGLAIVTAHHTLKEPLASPLTGVMANIPACMSEETVPGKYKHLWVSREQNSEALTLDRKLLGIIEEAYGMDVYSEDYSPFNDGVLFEGLPRTYVQVAGMDTLRDDGIVYAKSLRDCGVDVKLDVYPGVPHGHFNIWPGLGVSVKSQVDTIWNIGWLLERGVERERVEELWIASMG